MILTGIFKGNLEPEFTKIFAGANWILLCIFVVTSSILSTPEMTSGILAGGIIANLNCLGLDKDCQRMVRWRSMGAYYAGMAVRMALVCLAVTLCMLFFSEYFSPVGIFIGLSVAVVNFYLIVLGMLVYRFRFKEAV